MASLIDELIDVLKKENEEYQKLIPISSQKTRMIVKNDVEKLRQVTAIEQEHLGILVNLEKKRQEVANDIALVMNLPAKDLTIIQIVKILEGQKDAQRRLSEVHDELKMTLSHFSRINEQNQRLIKESLELIDFNLNYLKGMYQAPEVANYTKEAYNASPKLDVGVFDAKQ